jgi:4-alpha-glucanotransferase
MTDKFLAQQIAVLGRLCGIMPGFQDNEGKRHRTSQATYKALLTTMGVPWDNPDVLRMEIERRQVHLFDRLLQPVTAISSASAGNELTVLVRTSGPEEPASLPAWAEIRAKKGGRWEVEGFLTTPSKPHRHPVTGGFRNAMTLALPKGLGPGYYEVTVKVKGREGEDVGEALLVAAPETAYQPPFLAGGRRLWGFNLPLYALTGSRNWGMGDFTNLREMIAWAGDLGAAFVGVNPLHAPPPLARDDLSPYSPTSRMLLSFLYLDLEKVPELAESSAAQALLADPEFQAAKARACAAPLVAYAEVFRLKRHLLGPLFDTFWARHGGEEPTTPRGQEFARFRGSAEESLQKFAEFAALAEHWGESDWRWWPPDYQHPGSPAVAGFAREHRREVLFHQFVQWLASTQLDQAKEQAYQTGVPFTLYQDLALGSIAGGFETWAYPGLFAQGAAIGAPADAFNPKGQDWGLPPMIPERLLDLKFQPFINTLRANLPVDGMLRLDHVMALFRLFWIPHTEPKTAGAYVNYPARELLAILALESQRRRTLIIGEDLGTVAPHIRRQLRKQGILSYRVFYFERRRDGGFREPEDYPRQAMAAVTTHDLPTLAGFWEGRDIQVRQALNLYPKEQMAANDARDRKQDRKNLLNALERQRLLPQVRPAELAAARTCPEEVRLGVLEYLGQSAAALVEIRLEDVFGVVEQQNLPGTITEYPNWKHKIPLSLAQMRATPEPRDLAHRMTRCSRNSKTKD